ncbi:MAG: imidazole glycerol phosphate synthase subunit HisH [Gammaproteobacteria bacterium]
MIAVVDCGMGNLHSVESGLRRAGGAPVITSAAEDIDRADKIVLPGDGHFAAAMCEINRRNLRAALLRAAEVKPFLGICIGMQVLYEGSDEAEDAPGLGLFRGRGRKLSAAKKIPHIGWNTVRQKRPHPILRGVPDGARFYFIHSYFCPPDNAAATAEYGETIGAAAAQNNIFATQFHPEKSARHGARMLENFAAG